MYKEILYFRIVFLQGDRSQILRNDSINSLNFPLILRELSDRAALESWFGDGKLPAK